MIQKMQLPDMNLYDAPTAAAKGHASRLSWFHRIPKHIQQRLRICTEARAQRMDDYKEGRGKETKHSFTHSQRNFLKGDLEWCER